MKALLTAAAVTIASVSAASAATFVATFNDLGFNVSEGPAEFATPVSGTVAFTSNLGGTGPGSDQFFSSLDSLDLTGSLVADLDFGFSPRFGEEEFGTGFSLSAFDPFTGAGGDFEIDFTAEELNQLVTAEAGSVFTFSPLFAFEVGVTEAGVFFERFFNGTGSVSFEVVTAFGDEPAPVPLPASGLLLVGALGGVRLLRKRKA